MQRVTLQMIIKITTVSLLCLTMLRANASSRASGGKDRPNVPGDNLRTKINSFVDMAAERGEQDANGSRGMVHGVRSLGSAALDLAYTAMGSLDIW